jgi:glycosyltransferase involved in cell wall biosynthesis
MTLGVVVRDDHGGLGNLTSEVFTQMRPEITLVVQSRPCRGEPRPALFEEPWTKTFYTPNPVTTDTWEMMAGMADIWWSAETWYCDDAEQILEKAQCKSILYAMPELFAGSDATEVWNPTEYLTERTRLSDVVPWPCSPPEKWELRTKISRILHISSGAVGDRNGTATFLAALQKVRTPVEVFLHQPDKEVRVPQRRLASLPANIRVKQTSDYLPSMKSLYQWADMVVLPRKYAGLCLPAFEAFGYGCLVMMPDVDPQVNWPIVGIEAERSRPWRMKGGRIPIWEVSPNLLAERLETVLDWSVHDVVRRSERGRQWAESMSWEALGSLWRERLGGRPFSQNGP